MKEIVESWLNLMTVDEEWGIEDHKWRWVHHSSKCAVICHLLIEQANVHLDFEAILQIQLTVHDLLEVTMFEVIVLPT